MWQRETFGGYINSAGVVDGWRAYNIIPVLPRCWAHLIRDVDAFIEQPGGKELSEAIHGKFKALKEFPGKDPPASMEERKRQKKVWDREMAELAEQFSKFEELKKPVIAQHFDQTFLKFESENFIPIWSQQTISASRLSGSMCSCGGS